MRTRTWSTNRMNRPQAITRSSLPRCLAAIAKYANPRQYATMLMTTSAGCIEGPSHALYPVSRQSTRKITDANCAEVINRRVAGRVCHSGDAWTLLSLRSALSTERSCGNPVWMWHKFCPSNGCGDDRCGRISLAQPVSPWQ